ncbi:MAG: pyruvate kinase [Firmicutes bacterium]|nr:pyruvate kinase [Bacillota bacterium]
MRNTKIVATLGPASLKGDVFRRMVAAGVDVARVNLSHGSVDRHRETIRLVRAVEREAGRPIGILLDTAGPEVRVRTRDPQGLALEPGSRVTLGLDEACDLKPTIPGVVDYIARGHRLIVGDGNIILEAVDVTGSVVEAVVVAGGLLGDNKKITCPGVDWALPVLTEQDKASLAMGIEEGIDWIAASFIRTGDDVIDVRRQVESWGGGDIPIMAKIETRLAIDNLDAIVRLADGMMVARGDLGVEFPPEDVPWLQKQIIEAANQAGKPVITATQMLESMVHEGRPTRAEVTDIFHAVWEGTDAVMLSEETAVGDYPVAAVEVMARTAEVSEQHLWDRTDRGRYRSGTVTDAVCHAALTAAEDLGARLIITATESGHTARSMAAHRPRVPILAVTPYERVARRLTMVWGLHTHLMSPHITAEAMIDEAAAIAMSTGWADPGDRVIITLGAPLGESGSTNVLRVVTMGDVLLRGQGLGPEGEVQGHVLVLTDPERVTPDMAKGRVVVVAHGNPEWTPYMEQACAIIAESGGLTSPPAIVGISLGIPTIIGVTDATVVLSDNQWVTVDARAGVIRQGHRASS